MLVEDVLLLGRGAVEPQARQVQSRSPTVHSRPPCEIERQDADPVLALVPDDLARERRQVDAAARAIQTSESKTTMLTSGRAAMFRECRASGRETQKKSRNDEGAKSPATPRAVLRNPPSQTTM